MYLIFNVLFPNWYSEKTWTVGKNIFYTTLVFFIIGFGNLLYSVSRGFLDFSIESFWFYQGLTLAVGIFPVVVSTLFVYNIRLKRMVLEAAQLNQEVNNKTENNSDQITIPSQNKSEELNLNVEALLAIKAVENYIEVYANENGKLTKTILRNTLKNAEESLATIKNISKCHRSYLVNLKQVQHFSGNAQGLTLDFGNLVDLSVPVSRAYVYSIKSSLKKR
jgi:DNA-binding LytR/AlgR family response regulator